MVLEQIIAAKKESLAQTKKDLSLRKLEQKINKYRDSELFTGSSLKEALTKEENIAIIAEIKKASPSQGILREDFAPLSLAKSYLKGGASALSVLTEEKFFLGKPAWLDLVKEEVGDKLPVLRKDFIIDPYQVYETAALKGDALLLLVCVLDKKTLSLCLRESKALNLDCLVEVHNEKELDIALTLEAEIIGINNRDLKTFRTSTLVTKRLSPFIPAQIAIVTESGLKSRQDLEELALYPLHGALIGETLVKSSDPTAKLAEFVNIKRKGGGK